MSSTNPSKDNGVLEKTSNETASEQKQPQPEEPPSSFCMDGAVPKSPSVDSSVSLPKTPPPVIENKMEASQTISKQQSHLNQLLEQFLAYESSLSMTDYIKRFYQIRLEQEALRTDPEYSTKCASESVHVMRNRYRDILPYDRNRVVLSSSEDNPNGYINASFISLPKGVMRFIAAQAPLPTTLEEWWKMVDEQKVVLVVMLCKLVEMNKVKCERYWPAEIGQSLLFGCYEITLDAVETFADDEYLLRRLRMTNHKSGEFRAIHQLHYKEWPDHGCPSGESQLINMIENMAELHEKTNAPILVHCSAGVGRTGTIISVNYIRELIKSSQLESLDLFELVMSLRKQRSSMVQTQDQYQFVHRCVAYYCRRHLGIPHPEPPKEDLDDSFSAPSPLAPTFNKPLQINGDQLIQIDDSDDESESGNSVPGTFSARAACSKRSRRTGQRGKLKKSVFESRKVSDLWKVIRDSRAFRNVSKLFGSP
ncbi:Tyrosine-protein phosphatase [Trichostrongylus colubriformis]|uniref:protein-tyrosine-phosphatase n=1 Tax=Trichostrongylus colubriformis TaxID=6319 RepID=A0AAN8FYK8_TRICO